MNTLNKKKVFGLGLSILVVSLALPTDALSSESLTDTSFQRVKRKKNARGKKVQKGIVRTAARHARSLRKAEKRSAKLQALSDAGKENSKKFRKISKRLERTEKRIDRRGTRLQQQAERFRAKASAQESKAELNFDRNKKKHRRRFVRGKLKANGSRSKAVALDYAASGGNISRIRKASRLAKIGRKEDKNLKKLYKADWRAEKAVRKLEAGARKEGKWTRTLIKADGKVQSRLFKLEALNSQKKAKLVRLEAKQAATEDKLSRLADRNGKPKADVKRFKKRKVKLAKRNRRLANRAGYVNQFISSSEADSVAESIISAEDTSDELLDGIDLEYDELAD